MNSLESPQIISLASNNLTYTPFETLWIPNTSRFVVLGENPRRTGAIEIYELNFKNKENNDNNTKTLSLQTKCATPYGFKCGTFGQSYNSSNESNNNLATGDFKGNLSIWDLTKLSVPIFEVKNAHKQIINSIDGISGKYGAGELVTGSRDGTVKVWDPRTDECVSEMKSSDVNNIRDCWCVCFGNSYNHQNRMIAAGYDNGDVKILDLRTNKLFYETNVKNGVCCLQFDRNDIKLNKLIITTLESQYRIYDMKTRHISDGFEYLNIDTNFTNNKFIRDNNKKSTTIWKCRHLPQNRDIWITCSGNGDVNLWKYMYPDERFIVDDKGYKRGVMGNAKLLSNKSTNNLSTQPIVSWNWNKNKYGLACMASLDQSIHVVIVTKLNKF